MKGKRGIEVGTLIPYLIGLGVLVIAFIAMKYMKVGGVSLIDKIKDFLHFG